MMKKIMPLEEMLAYIEDIDLSQQNLFNNLKGGFLELSVQVTLFKLMFTAVKRSDRESGFANANIQRRKWASNR